MAEGAISGPYLRSWSEFLGRQLGWHFPGERWTELERKTGDIASAFGLQDAESCARRLLSQPLTKSQVDILASHLTVGETYFFRERRTFEILEQQVLPHLIEERASTSRQLRIWSAGCCTGEEPYSIAMLLDRLISDFDRWDVTILATDVNPQFLRKAASGIYGEWSFRDTPGWLRERYFKQAARGRWEVRPSLRKRVTFSQVNLACDSYPSSSTNTEAMDLILCRNVLMYFTPDSAKAVVERFYRSAVTDGWLVVSPAEASRSLLAPFELVQFPGATLCRKTDPSPPRSEDRRWGEPTWPHDATSTYPPHVHGHDQLEQLDAPPVERAPATLAPPLPTPADPPAHPARESHSKARSCADRGQLVEGAEWCRKAIQLERMNPAHHYLLATIQQEMGELDLAIQTLGSALYLDPDYILAHFCMGRLRLAQGRRQDASRSLDVARALLQRLPPEAILPDSDGLAAARLDEVIENIRSSIHGTHQATSRRGGA
jgi:chemotaxis protein methyltransferase CheR